MLIIKRLTVLLLLLISACSQQQTLTNDDNHAALTQALSTLLDNNSPESQQIAYTAIYYPLQLAEQYDSGNSAIFHNALVNLGIKPRGLCCHWTRDLMDELQQLNLQRYDLHWGVSHYGSLLQEHSTVVITKKDEPFNSGMVLDPWRNSGQLFWSLITKDKYTWQRHPETQDNMRIDCL